MKKNKPRKVSDTFSMEVATEKLNYLDVASEEVVSINHETVSIQDIGKNVTGDDHVSLAGNKRKYCGQFESYQSYPDSKVSKYFKSSSVTSSKNSAHDHTYCVKSPRRLKRQVDDLIDEAERLKKRVKTSKQKTRRLKRKVKSLTSVVSELKRKHLINEDCANIYYSSVVYKLNLKERLVSNHIGYARTIIGNISFSTELYAYFTNYITGLHLRQNVMGLKRYGCT